jgi:hypothetical protein
MDAIFRIFNSWSTCMFCGGTVDTSNIKFCNICCKNILGINDHLIRIRIAIDDLKKPQLIDKPGVLSTRLGIKCRKDFKEWAKRNHPDKGGNPEIYRKVSQLVDRKFPRV